jgi:hypothetical protein
VDDNYTMNLSIGSTSVPAGRVVGLRKHHEAHRGDSSDRRRRLPVAALTTITPADAAGTPDYAIAAVTSSSPLDSATPRKQSRCCTSLKTFKARPRSWKSAAIRN